MQRNRTPRSSTTSKQHGWQQTTRILKARDGRKQPRLLKAFFSSTPDPSHFSSSTSRRPVFDHFSHRFAVRSSSFMSHSGSTHFPLRSPSFSTHGRAHIHCLIGQRSSFPAFQRQHLVVTYASCCKDQQTRLNADIISSDREIQFSPYMMIPHAR